MQGSFSCRIQMQACPASISHGRPTGARQQLYGGRFMHGSTSVARPSQFLQFHVLQRTPAAAASTCRRRAVCAVAAAAPADVMSDLAHCFHSQLSLTNGCMPGSLLLHEVLAARGIQSRLKSGYLLMSFPGSGGGSGSGSGGGEGGPEVFAVAHLWVEAQGPDGDVATLDIGSAIAAAAGADFSVATLQLLPEVPAGARRADLADPEMGGAATAAEAAMAVMADASTDKDAMQELMGAYWGGAPPSLKAFREDMLSRFASEA